MCELSATSLPSFHMYLKNMVVGKWETDQLGGWTENSRWARTAELMTLSMQWETTFQLHFDYLGAFTVNTGDIISCYDIELYIELAYISSQCPVLTTNSLQSILNHIQPITWFSAVMQQWKHPAVTH